MGARARDVGDGAGDLGMEALGGGEVPRALGEDSGFVNEESRYVPLEPRLFREQSR
jgi:hypothetical protein